MSDEAWIVFYFAVFLKLPVIAMIALLFYAAGRDQDSGGGGGGPRKAPQDPRGPLEREIALLLSKRERQKAGRP